MRSVTVHSGRPRHRASAKTLGLVLLALCAGRQAADAEDWTTHRYPADRFEVEFSGPVQVMPTKLSAAKKKLTVRSTDYLQDSDVFAFIVNATLTRYSVEFDEGADASYQALKCKTTVFDRPLPIDGGQGREIRGEDCANDLHIEGHYFTTGKWFFQVLFVGSKGYTDEAAPQHFFQSFKIIDQ
jgi:hypothetical protein